MPPLLWLVPVSADTPSCVSEAASQVHWASKTPLAAVALVVQDEFPVFSAGFVGGITCKAVLTWKAMEPRL